MEKNWNISGLIIEGISGTGKTALLNSLIKSTDFRDKKYPSSIILSEHQTQRVLERKERDEGLCISDNIELLDSHLSYLEALDNQLAQMQWCRSKQVHMRIPYILERFHFTHVYHYNHISWEDVEKIDLRLSAINCKLCILTLTSKLLEKRLFYGRDEAWSNYLKRYGDSNEKILEYFIEQQDQLIELAGKSRLETLIIDASIFSIDAIGNKVLSFWKAL